MTPYNSGDPVRPLDNNEEEASASSRDATEVKKTEDEKEMTMNEDDEEIETKKGKVMRDPGSPTKKEIDEHKITHLPFLAWCAACITGSAKDRPHRKYEGVDMMVDTIVFDYGFLGTNEVKQTLPIQIMKHVQTKMICAHAVPRKGLMDIYGADELIDDIEQLGLKEIILKSDGEPALKAIREEVKHRREEKTILENSPVGDSRANGHAERAVQSIAAHVRTLSNSPVNTISSHGWCNTRPMSSTSM